jgi:hypothetical protein
MFMPEWEPDWDAYESEEVMYELMDDVYGSVKVWVRRNRNLRDGRYTKGSDGSPSSSSTSSLRSSVLVFPLSFQGRFNSRLREFCFLPIHSPSSVLLPFLFHLGRYPRRHPQPSLSRMSLRSSTPTRHELRWRPIDSQNKQGHQLKARLSSTNGLLKVGERAGEGEHGARLQVGWKKEKKLN